MGAVRETRKAELANYVRAKYKLAGSAPLQISQDAPVLGTCFRQLTFDGESTLKKWQLRLYLSPDGRYLSPDLFDTNRDPVEEEHARMTALMSDLAQNKGASLGPDDAPVTIVEFSDFQCPYCRKFNGILEQVLSSDGGGVRVVFHHMPLSMHPWARLAAQGAACAQLQNRDAFWSLQSKLFQGQAGITPENVKVKLSQMAAAIPKLDRAAFQTCLDDDLSFGLVFRDIELASSYGINGTPTVFINGRRAEAISDAGRLKELISSARRDLNRTPALPQDTH